MTKPTLLALCSLFPEQMERLEQDFEIVRLYKEPDPEIILNAIKNNVTSILATMGNQVQSNLIYALPNLGIITLKSVGFDNVDLTAAQQKGVIVTNTPDLVTADTADTALGLLLNVSRRFVELDAYLRVGHWQNGVQKPLGRSLSGKKIGIVGLGRIGQAIAKRCEAFDMDISYYGHHKKEQFSFKYFDNLIEMSKYVDYLIAVVPGGNDTVNLINKEVLDALGNTGFLINVSRGSVVDESALVTALQNNIIAGAALDVYENEPNVPDELKSMDNVVLFPHVGAATHETLFNMGELIIENLLAYKAGKPVKTPIQ